MVGSRIATEASARGHQVLAVSRSGQSPVPGVTATAADATDAAKVADLRAAPTRSPPHAYRPGTGATRAASSSPSTRDSSRASARPVSGGSWWSAAPAAWRSPPARPSATSPASPRPTSPKPSPTATCSPTTAPSATPTGPTSPPPPRSPPASAPAASASAATSS
ncbi:hypothetical protein ACRAWF_29620 [Streptomyces sp. L7]